MRLEKTVLALMGATSVVVYPVMKWQETKEAVKHAKVVSCVLLFLLNQ